MTDVIGKSLASTFVCTGFDIISESIGLRFDLNFLLKQKVNLVDHLKNILDASDPLLSDIGIGLTILKSTTEKVIFRKAENKTDRNEIYSKNFLRASIF